MNDKMNIILDIADKANKIINNDALIIPILNNFEIVDQKEDANNNYFVAKYKNTLEQFIVDGVLKEAETYDEHIKKVNESIKDNVIDNELYENKNFLIYYKAHQTPDFQFKLYLQDILVGTKENLNFIRQLTAYFMNDKTNEFCQLSLATGPFPVNERFKLLDNIKDLDNDEVISILEKSLNVIMNNIHYE